MWNGLIDRHPALVVRCTGVADVLQAVAFAREHDLLLSVRGGGHNVAGTAVNDGGLVIDLSLMRGVHVDPATRTARVHGGATWGDVDRETQVYGLATPGGVVSTTGVAGLTLHGGFGYLRNKHGLSLDNLCSVDIVTADGRVRTASPTEHPDLFWAVRGAGSNFGVVTSFEFRLHPVGPTVMLCAPLYALEDAQRVLPRWRDYVATAPDELSTTAVFWSVPPGLPHQLGRPVDLGNRPILAVTGLYAGPVEAGERVTRPLRELATPLLDVSGPLPYDGRAGRERRLRAPGPPRLLEVGLRRGAERRPAGRAMSRGRRPAVPALGHGHLGAGRGGHARRRRRDRLRPPAAVPAVLRGELVRPAGDGGQRRLGAGGARGGAALRRRRAVPELP